MLISNEDNYDDESFNEFYYVYDFNLSETFFGMSEYNNEIYLLTYDYGHKINYYDINGIDITDEIKPDDKCNINANANIMKGSDITYNSDGSMYYYQKFVESEEKINKLFIVNSVDNKTIYEYSSVYNIIVSFNDADNAIIYDNGSVSLIRFYDNHSSYRIESLLNKDYFMGLEFNDYGYDDFGFPGLVNAEYKYKVLFLLYNVYNNYYIAAIDFDGNFIAYTYIDNPWGKRAGFDIEMKNNQLTIIVVSDFELYKQNSNYYTYYCYAEYLYDGKKLVFK